MVERIVWEALSGQRPENGRLSLCFLCYNLDACFSQVTVEDFRKVVREKIVPSGDPKTWTFDGYVLQSMYFIQFRDPVGF